MDFIEGLPLSDGYDCILVVVDRLTKMSRFIPTLKTDDAPELAYVFLREIFAQHGLPADIVSDRGKLFTSEFWASLCDLLRIKSNLSTAYHPETDGQTERVNQILEQYLRIYVNYQQDDWVSLLPLAEFAYNNTSHSATGVSPFFANKGYHPNFSIDLHDVSSAEASAKAKDLDSLHDHLKEQISLTIRRYSDSAETRRDPIPGSFEVDDFVWLDSRNIITKRPMKKLDHKRIGPFRITEKISTHARRLELPKQFSGIHPVFHVSLLEPDHPNTIPNRIEDPPPPVEIDGAEEYEVEEIIDSKIDKRYTDGGLLYTVRWKGYEGKPDEISTHPVRSITNADDLIRDFHKKYPRKPGPLSKLLRTPPPQRRRKHF